MLAHSRGRPRGNRGANTAISLSRRAVGGRADPIPAAPVWHPQPEMAVLTAHPGHTKGLTPKTAVCAVLEVRATPPQTQAGRPPAASGLLARPPDARGACRRLEYGFRTAGGMVPSAVRPGVVFGPGFGVWWWQRRPENAVFYPSQGRGRRGRKAAS